jgi:hypothetical protein
MLHERGAVLTGLGLGASLMYLLDPERGRRRRALARDRIAHAARIGGDAIEATGRDVVHRASGATARLRGIRHREAADDHVLVERVRAKLGRLVSHPRAIDVEASDGVVTVRGQVLQAEVKRLIKKINRIPGVQEVVSELAEHKDAGHVPALQGGGTAAGPLSGFRQRQWSPTTRLLTGTTGMALAGYGASRRDARGAVLAAAGLGLLARAANLDASRVTKLRGRRQMGDDEKVPQIDTSNETGASREEQRGEVLR